MITRIFQKFVLNFKHDSLAIVKYYHSIDHYRNSSYRNLNTYLFSENKVLFGYFSNEQNSLKTRETPLCQQTYIPILNGPLCCKNNTILARTNSVSYYPVTVNSIRQYSNSASSIVDQAVMYNNGIIRFISESFFVECIMNALRTLHYSTGLPWWATIILATLCTRTFITFPLTIHQHQVLAKIENLQHEMKKITETLTREIKRNVINSKCSTKQAQQIYNNNVKQKWKELVVKENCHPFKIIVMVILQTPIWLGFSYSLRNFCYMLPKTNDFAYEDYLQFTTGGFEWMKNLTEMDHSYILPTLFGISTFAMIEIQCMLYNKNTTRFRRIYTNFLRILTVCLVPIVTYLPSGLTLFWTTNNLCTLSQTLLLLSPKIRRLGKVSKTDSELQHPYAVLYNKMKERLHL